MRNSQIFRTSVPALCCSKDEPTKNANHAGTAWRLSRSTGNLPQLGFVLLIAVCLLSNRGFMRSVAGESKSLPNVSHGIHVFPSSVLFDGPRQRMHFLVSQTDSKNAIYQDLTRDVKFESSDERVVHIEDGVARPVGNGSAKVNITHAGWSTSIDVNVAGISQQAPVSFHYEILPLLTRHNCNSGGCHGAPNGKGGFRMSLFAYDPLLDVQTLIHEEAARRTNRFNPALSLLVQKPSMRVSHGGGQRIRHGELSYRILRQWISEGCVSDVNSKRVCIGVDIQPTNRVLADPHWKQQLVVSASYSDGSKRDVTHLANIFSSDETIATVDHRAVVSGIAHGETALVVRYLEHVAAVRLTFIKKSNDFVWTDRKTHNFIDDHVSRKLHQMQYLPSELCDDSTFVRRVYLDLIGVLPTRSEATQFINDDQGDKRSRLIDQLLDRPEFARYWANRWADLLRAKNETLGESAVFKLYEWLVDSIETNMPYDQFVRELLTASGNTAENPAANFFRAAGDTEACTETSAATFLGIKIQCAKCHNHPYERWTQDNYYGISALFNRIQRDQGANNSQSIWVARQGEIQQPRTDETMLPWLPNHGPFARNEDDPRDSLVDWLTQNDNQFLAKVQVNRMWSYLFGRGIVDPIDDFRDSNPPSNAGLLRALSTHFIKGRFDRKELIRTIVNSRTYQTSSLANEFNRADTKYLSHYPVRRLTAEQIVDAICRLTGVDEIYEGLPKGTLTTQLPNPKYKNEFLRIFGKPARNTACACERLESPDLAQALELVNGIKLDDKLRAPNTRFRKAMANGDAIDAIIDDLYWTAYSRTPSPQEKTRSLKFIHTATDQATAFEDLVWTLINRKEFLFQH